MIKKIFVNSAIYAIGPQIPQLLSVVMLPFLTPFLTTKDYGVYGVLIAYLTALTSLKELGFGVILTNTFYKYPSKYRHFWSRIFGFISISSVVVAALMSLVVYTVLPTEDKSNWTILVVAYCLPVALFDTTRWIVSKFFQLKQTPLPSILIVAVSGVVGVACNIITIRYLQLGYLGWFISGFFISFTSFLANFYFLVKVVKLKPSFAFNIKWLKPLLLIALPVLPHIYASYLLDSSDRLLLSWYKVDIDQIGLYNIAYIFGGYFVVAANAMTTATGPIYFELYAKGTTRSEIEVRRLTFLLEAILLIAGVFACIWFKEIFFLLIKNQQLNQAYPLAIIILMSYTAKALYQSPVCKLQYVGKTNQFWKISFLGGILNIVLNIALIPFWGIWGSVVATFISMMYISLSGYAVKDFIKLNKEKYYPLWWLAIIVLATVFCYLIRDVAIVYKIVVSFVLGGSVLFASRKMRHWVNIG